MKKSLVPMLKITEGCISNVSRWPTVAKHVVRRRFWHCATTRRKCYEKPNKPNSCSICQLGPKRNIHLEGPKSTGGFWISENQDLWSYFRTTTANLEDLLFNMLKNEQDVVHAGTFLALLEEQGLRRTDPRLQELMDNLFEAHSAIENLQHSSLSSTRLDKETFSKVIRNNLVLISRALCQKLVIPEWGDFCKNIRDLHEDCSKCTEGRVATYIPQLARFDPDLWGVAVCSIDGQRYGVGDTLSPFTMQSCSKPMTYAIALNELGSEVVHQMVGQEPSGRMFNAIVLDYNTRPHNPLVNAGAILINGLLHTLANPDMASSEKFDFLQQYLKRMAGNEMVGFNNATFLSEREHADRNYALGYYMRENKCFPPFNDLQASMDLYFQSCSMEVNAESLSVMGATLANGGICPITGEKVLQPSAVRDVLSLMHSCGMYDYSGQFAFKVGLPAKSGVCGAILAVIPNVMSICCWSPPLDSLGNSVRGIKFFEKLVDMFNFHRYDNLRFAVNKKDPRRQRYESRGRKVVSLLFSAAAGDVSALRRNAISGMNMEETDYDGRTALHLAAVEGHADAVKFLINKCKVNPEPTDRWNSTPAQDATKSGHQQIVTILEDAAVQYNMLTSEERQKNKDSLKRDN